MTKSILFLATLTALAGCGSKESASPSSGFEGKVQLTDEFGKAQTDQSGVLVTITDITPQLTTRTAADGSYTLTNVPDGSHTVSFSKTGYGTYLQPSVVTDPHKMTTLDAAGLSQVSTTIVTLSRNYLKVKDPTYNTTKLFLISGTVSPAPTATQPRPHRLFLQAYDEHVTPLPMANNYGLTLRGYTRPDGSFVDTVTAVQLASANLISGNGETVRIRATGDNLSAPTYYDYLTTKTIYPAANLAMNPNFLEIYAMY